MSIQFLLLLLFIGLMAGRVSSVWAVALIEDSIRSGLRRCDSCNQPFSGIRQLLLWYPGIRCPACKSPDRFWPFWSTLAISMAFAGFGWLLLTQNCQSCRRSSALSAAVAESPSLSFDIHLPPGDSDDNGLPRLLNL
jgi:hypothetical protein